MDFDQWWDVTYPLMCPIYDVVKKDIAREAWLAAIKYAEANIGLDKPF